MFPNVPIEYRLGFLARELDYTREHLDYFLSLAPGDSDKLRARNIVDDKRNEFYKMWISAYNEKGNNNNVHRSTSSN